MQNAPPAPRPRIVHAPRRGASSWKGPRDDSAGAALCVELRIPAQTQRYTALAGTADRQRIDA